MVLHAWDARGHLWRTVGSKGAAGGREGEKVEEFTTWPSQLRGGSGGQLGDAIGSYGGRTRQGGGWMLSCFWRRGAVGERARGGRERGGHAQLLEEP